MELTIPTTISKGKERALNAVHKQAEQNDHRIQVTSQREAVGEVFLVSDKGIFSIHSITSSLLYFTTTL